MAAVLDFWRGAVPMARADGWDWGLWLQSWGFGVVPCVGVVHVGAEDWGWSVWVQNRGFGAVYLGTED